MYIILFIRSAVAALLRHLITSLHYHRRCSNFHRRYLLCPFSEHPLTDTKHRSSKMAFSARLHLPFRPSGLAMISGVDELFSQVNLDEPWPFNDGIDPNEDAGRAYRSPPASDAGDVMSKTMTKGGPMDPSTTSPSPPPSDDEDDSGPNIDNKDDSGPNVERLSQSIDAAQITEAENDPVEHKDLSASFKIYEDPPSSQHEHAKTLSELQNMIEEYSYPASDDDWPLPPGPYIVAREDPDRDRLYASLPLSHLARLAHCKDFGELASHPE